MIPTSHHTLCHPFRTMYTKNYEQLGFIRKPNSKPISSYLITFPVHTKEYSSTNEVEHTNDKRGFT